MAEKWIQKAIRRPGAFRVQARRLGLSARAFAKRVLSNPKKYSSRTVRRARLALTLMSMRKKRG